MPGGLWWGLCLAVTRVPAAVCPVNMCDMRVCVCGCVCVPAGLGAEGPTRGRVRRRVRAGVAALSWVLATLYITQVRIEVTCLCSV